MRLDCFVQNGVMSGEEGGQGGRILLRQRGAAFDVGEEECDRAGREFTHQSSPMHARLHGAVNHVADSNEPSIDAPLVLQD